MAVIRAAEAHFMPRLYKALKPLRLLQRTRSCGEDDELPAEARRGRLRARRLHIEPLVLAIDSRGRTGRVDQGYRAVMFRIDADGE